MEEQTSLAIWIEREGLKKLAVARRLGISQSELTFALYPHRYRRRIPLKTLIGIAALLGKSLEEICKEYERAA